jgi:uncharacterized protein
MPSGRSRGSLHRSDEHTVRRPTLDPEEHRMNEDLQRQLTNVSRGLVAVGGLNWGLVGLFGVDLVATVFGSGSKAARAVYTAVGAATVYTVVNAVTSARGGDEDLGTVDPSTLEGLSETSPFGPMDAPSTPMGEPAPTYQR